MAQAIDPRPRDRVVHRLVVSRVVVSVLATAGLSALAAAFLTLGGTAAEEFRAAALVAGLSAFTSFVGAAVILSVTRRLMPALWGYVPGFVAAVAACLWLGEAARPGTPEGAWWVGSLAMLNPLFWVPIYLGVVIAVRRAG